MKDYREISLWKNVTPEEWNDWHWQLANRITDIETLGEIITLTSEEKKALNDDLLELRMAITPYYATLMDPKDVNCPIRMQAVPTSKERNTAEEDFYDPLAEDRYAPVPGFVHRYPDRGILLVTDQCSMYCRFCTRRRFAGEVDRPKSREEIQAAIDYIERTPVLRDVLVTGGDPLTMEDDNLEWLLASLRRIPHVEIIRIGTRVPAVMPQRITSSLVSMLRQFHPLWINVHFNHPKNYALLDQSLKHARRCRHTAWQPIRAASWHKRLPLHLQGAVSKAFDEQGASLLHISMRPITRHISFSHLGRQGHRDHRIPARAYNRHGCPYLRDRRPRRRRQDPAHAKLPAGPGRAKGCAQEL